MLTSKKIIMMFVLGLCVTSVNHSQGQVVANPYAQVCNQTFMDLLAKYPDTITPYGRANDCITQTVHYPKWTLVMKRNIPNRLELAKAIEDTCRKSKGASGGITPTKMETWGATLSCGYPTP